MATSFTDIMERIKADLAAGSLAALVATYWPDKALARRIAFKPRLQIGIDELPVLMITSPADEKGDRSSFDRQHREEIRLYFGFHDTDPERAPIRMVKAVEALDDDILRYRPHVPGRHRPPSGVRGYPYHRHDQGRRLPSPRLLLRHQGRNRLQEGIPMTYRLRENAPDFECIEGPLSGRKYEAGKTYTEIPPEEAGKFIEATEGSIPPDPFHSSDDHSDQGGEA